MKCQGYGGPFPYVHSTNKLLFVIKYHYLTHYTTIMNDDWDSKTVIGFKKAKAKTAKKESDLNGMFPSPSPYTSTDFVSSCKYSYATPSFTTSCICTKARRSGAVVATDKKITAGGNKAHQGSVQPLWNSSSQISHSLSGTDHQRIAKLDRENEVAPPAKIAPSVGRVGHV